MAHQHDLNIHDSCCSSISNLGLQQTLNEIDFERGIWYAAQYNDLDKVYNLLKIGTAVDIEDSAGYTALHYAARNGHYNVCELLLYNGANVNAQTRCGEATALHRAAMQGHSDIIRLLLKYGANPKLKDVDGCTALHRALASNSTSVCKILIPRSDLNSTNNKGCNAKQLAQNSCDDILSLISLSKNTNQK